METLLQPCKSPSFLGCSSSVNSFKSVHNTVQVKAVNNFSKYRVRKTQKLKSFYAVGSLESIVFDNYHRGTTQIGSCSRNDVSSDISSTEVPENVGNDRVLDNEEIGLLSKPNIMPMNNGLALEVEEQSKGTDEDEVLASFFKFMKPKDTLEELDEGGSDLGNSDGTIDVGVKEEDVKKVGVEYYEPKPGDFVVGVVVSGNENKLDVNIGADLLGTMLTKEVLPLYDKEMDYLLCDLQNDVEEFMVHGKMGIVKDDDAMSEGLGVGKPVVDIGTVLFAEVLGRTLSGRPLLSTRRLFRRIAWHRVRQIKDLNEPIEVRITEWNTGGLLTRVEGLRAFLPKAELVNRVNSFTELKENVGRRLHVQVTRINESNNDLILSEREAWEILNLQVGTLLAGTVKKIFPYGAQIRLGESSRSGLLHISKISRSRINVVSDLLSVDEKVKVLVVNSMFPDKISLSIADLESEPGLFISNKEKVFSESEEMAKKYKQKLPAGLATRKLKPTTTDTTLPFDNEASFYANWKWFIFKRDDESSQI